MEFARIDSPNFLVNAGLMIVIGVVVTILYMIGASIPASSSNNACVFTTNLFFKGFYVISFLPVLISILVQIKYLDTDDGLSLVGLVIALIVLAVLVASLVYLVIMTARSRRKTY